MSARRWAGAALVVGFVMMVAQPASAHPLGNFTINRFAALELSVERVTIRYALDMAEIPTFQERDRLDPNGDGRTTPDELDAYAKSAALVLRDGLSVTSGGDPVALSVDGAVARLREGQGGLDVLRLDAVFSSSLPSAAERVEYRDANYARRLGWKEIIARATGDQGIASSTVPTASISDGLRSYPKDMLSSPPDARSAVIALQPGAGQSNGSGEAGSSGEGSGGGLTARFTSLIGRDLSPPFFLFALLVAMGAGALHALGPGHGKSIMAAYLVGTEGRMRHAVAVGIAVSLMHTTSVVVLGLVVLGASRLFTPEAVFPWLSLASGVVVLALGAYLLRARLATRRAALEHSHDHDHDHAHDHDHSHGHGHSHSHAPAVSPTSWRGLGVIALSGGLLPSPSALVVLLGAVALHRVAFGVVLVAAFSVGLAGALTIVGALVIKARAVATRHFGRRVTVQLPVFSAAAIFAIGAFLTAGAVTRL